MVSNYDFVHLFVNVVVIIVVVVFLVTTLILAVISLEISDFLVYGINVFL